MGLFVKDDEALRWRGGQETVLVEPWGADSLRVRGTVVGGILDDQPGALLTAKPSQVYVQRYEGGARITNGEITAEMSDDGRLRFLRGTADLLTEPIPHFSAPPARRYTPVGGGAHRFETTFEAVDGERFYGLGQHQHGKLDNKGAVIDLVQRNTEVSIPFAVSSRGYGFLWNHPGIGRVELGTTATRWVSEQTRQWDYWITAGDPRQVLRNYAEATGKPPMLPAWASGFWQCKLRYKNQAEVLRVAREFKRRNLPLSVLVIDYFHWSKLGEWQFHPEDWPDPGAMVAELESMGVKTMVSIWPTVNPNSSNYAEMAQRGLLVGTEQGIGGQLMSFDRDLEGLVPMSYYDATNPEARAFIWEKASEGYGRHGIGAWWLDGCEPEQRPENPGNLRYHLGNGLEVGNIYPMLNAQAFWEGEGEGEENTVLLSRSAWAGSQRYGALVWSGDVPSTFDSLRRQITAGLNIAMSGIAWWNTDIGGFHGGNVEDSAFRELLVRWFQFGVFSPVCRLHGNREPITGYGSEATGAPNEPWTFGEATGEILRKWLTLREELRPYVLSVMREAHETGLPVLRPLFLEFQDDEPCWEIADQYLFGADYLVAPVLELGARERRVYLPAGTRWVDAWTGDEHTGGQWLQAPAPLEQMPVYLRAGTPHRPFRKTGGETA
jgi:alpha-D-xyloside xylohydrolase